MGKIKDHIAEFRTVTGEHTDSTRFTDKDIYKALNNAKMKLRDQTLSKDDKVSDFEYRTFCIELEKTKSHDCDCVPVGCTVLKSKYAIPGVATSRTKDHIKIHTLGDVLIPNRNEEEIKDVKTDDILGGKHGYMIRNQKIIIWNNLLYPAVMVTGYWDNLLDWEGIQYCSEDNPCLDIRDLDFDLEGGKVYDIYNMAAQQLGISIQLGVDITSNSNPDLRQ